MESNFFIQPVISVGKLQTELCSIGGITAYHWRILWLALRHFITTFLLGVIRTRLERGPEVCRQVKSLSTLILSGMAAIICSASVSTFDSSSVGKERSASGCPKKQSARKVEFNSSTKGVPVNMCSDNEQIIKERISTFQTKVFRASPKSSQIGCCTNVKSTRMLIEFSLFPQLKLGMHQFLPIKQQEWSWVDYPLWRESYFILSFSNQTFSQIPTRNVPRDNICPIRKRSWLVPKTVVNCVEVNND